MSDQTRTRQSTRGPNPDGLDEMGRQLVALAHAGLLVTKITAREMKKGDLNLLLAFASEATEIASQAKALIELVTLSCDELGPGPLGESARKYFGTGQGEREFPFERRHASASFAWNPDIQVASWDRKHRDRMIAELERKMLELMRTSEQSRLRDLLVQDYLPPPADASNDKPNSDFERLEFRAETHLIGWARRPLYTDWHYRDVATTSSKQFHRIFTQTEARVTIESLCDAVEVDQELGVNRYGYQLWLVRFLQPPQRGEVYEWSIRKHFSPEAEEASVSWLSLAVSQPKNIERGTFVVNLEQAEVTPTRFARFITPKMTLPTLRGPVWLLPPNGELRQTVTFEYLVPWHSHGIYWWWE